MTDPDEISQHAADQLRPVHAPRLTRLIWLLYAAVVLLLAAGAVVWVRSTDAAQEARDASTAAQQNAAALAQANDRLASLGGQPVSTPAPGPAGPQGEQGVQGPGPSAEQIDLAVASYCGAHSGCVGTPSRAQVAAAVQAYCQAGLCTGPTGPPGPTGPAGRDGKNGADGQQGAQGAQGPGPTDDQVQAAVTAYCAAHDGCAGPQGPAGASGSNGSDGPQGPAGRGITSVDCSGVGVDQLTIYYSDGTSETVTCGHAPKSSPSPTPSS